MGYNAGGNAQEGKEADAMSVLPARSLHQQGLRVPPRRSSSAVLQSVEEWPLRHG